MEGVYIYTALQIHQSFYQYAAPVALIIYIKGAHHS